MTAISAITSLTLDLPPSCIQFCPRHPEYFVVGTYFLHGKEQQGNLSTDITHPSSDASGDNDENPADDTTEPAPAQSRAQKRTGSLMLFKLENEQITWLSSTATDFAILDIQWAIHSTILGDLLAVATSTGVLAFYHLRVSAETPALVLSSTHAIIDPSILVLSLTWHPTHAHVLGVTLSNGSVQLCESTQSELWDQTAVLHTTEIHSHDLEAWTLAFTPGETTKVLSGGDDIALQCSHIDHDADAAVLLWRDRKLHEAGVTAILPLSETLIVTGSYDDHIRLLLSTPTTGHRRRQVLAELNLGGGVWRLKVLHAVTTAIADEAEDPVDPPQTSSPSPSALSSAPTRRSMILLLCSCMHAGARVVSLTRRNTKEAGARGEEEEGDWKFEVVGKFEEHGSMNYGSDVQPNSREGRVHAVVSTSFYDRMVCLWRVGNEEVVVS